MDFTKFMVEKLYEEFEPNGIIVVPVYDVKTVDIKRDNFLTVYTDNRTSTPAAIGGMSFFEDVSIVFDFRGGSYEKYVYAKNHLKALLEKYIRGFPELGIYGVDYVREDELSDKQRGMYRFVINVILYRLVNYQMDMIFYDDFCPKPYTGHNLTPQTKEV